MFVTVSYDGDGSDQPDYKTATKTIELMREAKGKPFFIAAGFVRPHILTKLQLRLPREFRQLPL